MDRDHEEKLTMQDENVKCPRNQMLKEGFNEGK